MRKLSTFFVSLLIFTGVVFSQTITVSTYGVSPRDAGNSEEDIFDLAYNGLMNVGIGTKIYLKGQIDEGSLNNPTWTIPSKPDGSDISVITTADMDSATQIAVLIPDTVGTYQIEFNDGENVGSITIVAGLYLGNSAGVANCSTVGCHAPIYESWTETGHSTGLDRGFDGMKSDHFGPNCVSCHSTGYDANAYNWGFDDWPFEFPDSLFVGMADSMKALYPDAMARSNIQCESCHGPGSNHALADAYPKPADKIDISLSSKVCAYCHDAGTHHVYPAQYDVSQHAKMDAPYTRSSCAPCHNGEGFVTWVKGGKIGLSEDVAENVAISCATCHDPHDATNEHQIRTVTATLGNGVEISNAGRGGLCMNCHKSRRDAVDYTNNYLDNISSHYGPHHGPQADVLAGENMPDLGKEMPSTFHNLVAPDVCVTCHMYPGHVDENKQVVLSGSHSFAMSTPEGVDNMAACTQCHTGMEAESFDEVEFALNGRQDLDNDGIDESLQEEIHGMIEKLEMLLPPEGEMDVNMDSTWTLEQAKAFYVLDVALEDGSFGIHNPKFISSLLMESLVSLGVVYTSVEKSDELVPTDFVVSQNYPNPFNPSTTISFSIPVDANVSVVIYNAIGEVAEELVNENMSAGNYNISWDASRYSSGVYFYKIQADDFVSVKKMLYLK